MMCLGNLGTADCSGPNAPITDRSYELQQRHEPVSCRIVRGRKVGRVIGNCPCVQGLTQFVSLIFWTLDWDTASPQLVKAVPR